MNSRADQSLINKYFGCLERNDCYTNALFVGRSEHLSKREVLFVLGTLTSDDTECPHAWLQIDGIEFDPTSLFLPNDSTYESEITIPIADALKISSTKISQLWNRRIDPMRYEEFCFE